jgi:hypothetical protein
MFAGHLPMKQFSHEEWSAMKVWPEGTEDIPENGMYRSTLRGRPIVFRFNWDDRQSYAVRLIVRVKMGRA